MGQNTNQLTPIAAIDLSGQTLVSGQALGVSAHVYESIGELKAELRTIVPALNKLTECVESRFKEQDTRIDLLEAKQAEQRGADNARRAVTTTIVGFITAAAGGALAFIYGMIHNSPPPPGL